jgi:hypothetical protein
VDGLCWQNFLLAVELDLCDSTPSESNQGSSIPYVYELGHPVLEYDHDFAVA